MNSKGIVFLLAGVALLGGLFVFFKPGPAAAPAAPAVSAAAPAEAGAVVAPTAPPEPKRFAISVKGGRVDGPGTMTVTQGESVVIAVTSDQADEMHLHGYGLELNVAPDVPAELRLVADRSGHFELEMHKHHAELGALEVQPKQ
jgi:hypothetical protein